MRSRIIFPMMVAMLLIASYTGNAHTKLFPGCEVKGVLLTIHFTGQVTEWVMNDDYIYDGFYVQTINKKYLVKFSPYLGVRLRTAIRGNMNVSVVGDENLSSKIENEIKLQSLEANGVKITSEPIAPEGKKEKEIAESKNGIAKISDVTRDEKGEVKALKLDNNTILCVPQHLRADITPIATRDANVTYTGTIKHCRSGEAAVEGVTIIKVESITINGKQFIAK